MQQVAQYAPVYYLFTCLCIQNTEYMFNKEYCSALHLALGYIYWNEQNQLVLIKV